METPSPVHPPKLQFRPHCPVDPRSPLLFSPWLKVFVASSLPARTGGNFTPVHQSLLPLAGSGYCQGITGQRQTFSGQGFNPKHLLQGDAECVVSVSASLWLFFLCFALQVFFKSKGRAIKERHSAFPARDFGSSGGTWIIFLPIFPFVHVFLDIKQYPPLMLQSRACSLPACARG